MLALVEIAGQQIEVEKNTVLNVPHLNGEPGSEVKFENNILLTEDGGNINVGNPIISGSVTAKILEHGKDEKVLVFHKKRRKGYRKLNGYRSQFTRIEITGINI
ncbi:MAG: 50S ribosomal protein L21 [Bacteroidetes bacterium]|nr:50S ribosomal protein L21 [Bacteroidota bacterium]